MIETTGVIWGAIYESTIVGHQILTTLVKYSDDQMKKQVSKEPMVWLFSAWFSFLISFFFIWFLLSPKTPKTLRMHDIKSIHTINMIFWFCEFHFFIPCKLYEFLIIGTYRTLWPFFWFTKNTNTYRIFMIFVRFIDLIVICKIGQNRYVVASKKFM